MQVPCETIWSGRWMGGVGVRPVRLAARMVTRGLYA
jgi:hypothetical protein